jgi:N-acyl-L-homoserine lactone synthetase
MRKMLFENKRFRAILVNPDGNAELRDMFEEFRYAHYVEKLKYEPPNEMGRERDACDLYSHYMMLFIDDRLVGGCRLIDGRFGALPISEAKEVEEILPNSVEVSRYLLTKKTSFFMGIRANRILCSSLYLAIDELGFENIYAKIGEKLLKALKIFSIVNLEQIGPVVHHEKAGPLIPVMQKIEIISEANDRLEPLR